MSNPKNHLFNTDHLKTGLTQRVVGNAAITLAAQGAKLVLQIVSIVVLARLLKPADFGLIAMATVFTGLALQFMEGGLSIATIQRDEINHAQVSNLFWVNSALGTGLCLLGVLFSPLVAMIYDEPRLTLVMAALSLTFLIGGVSVQHDALLRRQMRFKAISVIDISSMAGGVLAGIAGALVGLEYWALVISPIATFSIRTLLRWLSVGWMPSMITRGSGVRPLLNFGAYLTGANFIGYIATNVTSFSVGLVGGAQSLGLYNRANRLSSIPSSQILPPVMNLMQSALARVKDDPDRLRRVALSLMTKIAMATMFVTVLMFVTSDWLVYVLLGSGWEGAILMFRILAIATIVTPITTFTSIIMVATGHARALMRWKAITTIILVTSILIGSFWGGVGIVLAQCISGLFLRMPGFLFYSTKYQPIRFGEYFHSLYPVFFSAAMSIVLVMTIREYYIFSSRLMSITIYTILSALIYFSLSMIFKKTRGEMRDSLVIIKNIFRKSNIF